MKTFLKECFLFLFLTLLTGQISSQSDKNYRNNPLIQQADSLYDIWQWGGAISFYKKAQSLFKRQKQWDGYVHASSKIGGAYEELKEYDKALTILSNTLLEGKTLLGAEHPEIARIYYYMGLYYMDRAKRNMPKSLEAINKSLEIRQKIYPPYHEDIGDSHHLLGRYLNVKENFNESKFHHQQAVKIYEKILPKNHIKIARAYRYYGLTLYRLQDLDRALVYQLRAYNIYNDHPEASLIESFIIHENVANMYYRVDKFEDAIPFYEKAIELMDYFEGDDKVDAVNAMTNLASTYGFLNKQLKAEDLFRRALVINENANNTDSTKLMWTHEVFGDMFYNYNQVDSALVHLNKAREINNKITGFFESYNSDLLKFIGESYFIKGELDSSLFYIQRALIELVPEFLDSNYYSDPPFQHVNLPFKLFELLEMKGRIFYRIYNKSKDTQVLNASYKIYKTLDSLTDQIRNQLYSENTKIRISRVYKEQAGHALNTIDAINTLNPDQEYLDLAFHLMEKNRYSKIYNNQLRVKQFSSLGISDSLYN